MGAGKKRNLESAGTHIILTIELFANPMAPRNLVTGALAFYATSWLGQAASGAGPSPEQIHVSYGSDPQTTATLVWASELPCLPAAQFGPSPSSMSNVSTANLVSEPEWLFGNDLGLHFYMRALSGLPPGTRSFYRVGCSNGEWSETLNFSTVPSTLENQPHVLIWGDMGRVGGEQTLPALIAEANAAAAGDPGAAVFGIIAGDFAYDLQDGSGSCVEYRVLCHGTGTELDCGVMQAPWERAL